MTKKRRPIKQRCLVEILIFSSKCWWMAVKDVWEGRSLCNVYCYEQLWVNKSLSGIKYSTLQGQPTKPSMPSAFHYLQWKCFTFSSFCVQLISCLLVSVSIIYNTGKSSIKQQFQYLCPVPGLSLVFKSLWWLRGLLRYLPKLFVYKFLKLSI